MAILVIRAFSVIDGMLIGEELPKRSKFRHGDVAAVLTNLKACDELRAAAWEIQISVGLGPKAREVTLPLQAFLSAERYRESHSEPLPLTRLSPSREVPADWLWLYRDSFYVTEREPRESEINEVILRIKSLHFQRDDELKRLREQVANFEAIQMTTGSAVARRAIPDDVKLLVWTRDGGACIKCRAVKDLHFDHIIPLSRGGSDTAENIQILCRACNLAKSDRLA